MLHFESILQCNPFVQAVPSSKQKSKKKQKIVVKENVVAQGGSKVDTFYVRRIFF